MAQLIWERELNEPGIVAEYRSEGGVRVLIHNGAYFGISKEENERRKREAFRVAQEIMERAYMRQMRGETT